MGQADMKETITLNELSRICSRLKLSWIRLRELIKTTSKIIWKEIGKTRKKVWIRAKKNGKNWEQHNPLWQNIHCG